MQVVDFSEKGFLRALGAIARRAGVGVDDVVDYVADVHVDRLADGAATTPGYLVACARQAASWGRLRPHGRHEVPWPTDDDGALVDLAAPEQEEEEPSDLQPHQEEIARHTRSGGYSALATELGLTPRRVQQVVAAGDRSALERWGWLLLAREQQGDLLCEE